MNTKRRNDIKMAISTLEVAINELRNICDDEQFAFDNIPENLQSSERGENMEDAIDCLNDAIEEIKDIVSDLKEL